VCAVADDGGWRRRRSSAKEGGRAFTALRRPAHIAPTEAAVKTSRAPQSQIGLGGNQQRPATG
jgi:hypothetical protein